MSKSARVWVAGLCIGASAISGTAVAQVAPRKVAVSQPVGLGVPVVVPQAIKATLSPAARVATGAGSPVTFTSGQPAIRYSPNDLPSASDPVRREASAVASTAAAPGTSAKTFAPAPGTIRANMSPVTGAEAKRILQTRSFPASLNQGATTPNTRTGKTSTTQTLSAARVGGDANALGPASIAELARSLRNHPDLIYQYIRNNIEYYPTFGVQKGALGTILDNQGTAYDQATLMVELLRASGLTANYVQGVIKITAAQMTEWYGIDTSSVCGVLGLLGQAQIPIYGINATSAGSCPGLSAAMTDVSLEHIWVKVNIGGTNYVFDPSYKPHTFKTGIDLASSSTTGYDAATYLSSATSGATVATGAQEVLFGSDPPAALASPQKMEVQR